MQVRTYFDLKTLDSRRFYLRKESIAKTKAELETFLEDEKHLQTKAFAKKVMFSHEIKANNLIEGYGDDIEIIKKAIHDAEGIKDSDKRNRILNLYHAYNYILNGYNINPETLKKLYSITSKNVLEEYDKENMGDYYRTKPVYILQNGRLDIELDEGIPANRIEEFLESYFEFLNNNINGNETDEYIKSQILHFYFVYIHPYFDVNGRTSRTLSMWYLLNKKAYPYIIFNRGISFKGNTYDKTIVKSKESMDLTYFIELMLATVELELEKEYVTQACASTANEKLNATDYQTLLYFLSMKGLHSILDFAKMYNSCNDKKKVGEIYNEMIEPLLDKGVLDIKGTTQKCVGGVQNKVLILKRPNDVLSSKITHLANL